MTREELIAMAMEAGIPAHHITFKQDNTFKPILNNFGKGHARRARLSKVMKQLRGGGQCKRRDLAKAIGVNANSIINFLRCDKDRLNIDEATAVVAHFISKIHNKDNSNEKQ